jgi:hypothetical protein
MHLVYLHEDKECTLHSENIRNRLCLYGVYEAACCGETVQQSDPTAAARVVIDT